MENLILSIIAVFLGGIISYKSVMDAQEKAHKNTIQRNEQKQREELQAFLHSIHTEINKLADLYEEVVGKFLFKMRNATPPLEAEDVGFYFVSGQDYFTIYHQNAPMLGSIKDDSFRSLIVSTYSKAKQLLDGHSFHNMVIKDFNTFRILSEETSNPIYKSRELQSLEILRSSAQKLVGIYDSFSEDLKELNRRIKGPNSI